MQEKIKSLLRLAITAPSGDNCQPWRFSVNDSRIDLYNDPDVDTSYYNYLQRASHVSHGAVLENIAIAAPTLGLKPVFHLFPEADNQNYIAKIILEEVLPSESLLSPFIEHRTTNRKRYAGGLLSDSQIVDLAPAAKDLSKVSTFLTNSRSEIDTLSDVLSLSDRLVFETRPLHDFLFEHIRWSDEEATRYRDGLDIKTLELNAMDTLGFKLLKSWSFTRFACKFGAAKAISANARKLANSASAVGLILGQGSPDRDSYLEGGRLMQRLWLQATRMGYGFHPMTGLSFLMQRVVEQQTDEMTKKHICLIQEARQTIATVSRVTDPFLIGLYRVGTAASPSARSLRKELSELVI
jgi:hypothetical protein